MHCEHLGFKEEDNLVMSWEAGSAQRPTSRLCLLQLSISLIHTGPLSVAAVETPGRPVWIGVNSLFHLWSAFRLGTVPFLLYYFLLFFSLLLLIALSLVSLVDLPWVKSQNCYYIWYRVAYCRTMKLNQYICQTTHGTKVAGSHQNWDRPMQWRLQKTS